MNEVLVERLNDESVTKTIDLCADEKKTIIVFNNGKESLSYNLKATLKQGAELNIYNVITSSKNESLNEEITLLESGATCNVLNVVLLENDAVLDSLVMIHHEEKNTTSDFSNYAIAKNKAVLNLNNNATIKQGASKSIAHQKTKGLTLNKESKIKAMPNLYIDEYDVVASHACSIGSINKEDLFYLMSRGLSVEESSKLIVMGFIAPLIDRIDDQKLKEDIFKAFAERLS